MKKYIFPFIQMILLLTIIALSSYQLIFHPDYRRWHEAENITIRMPDERVVEGAGRWKSDTLVVTVEIDGIEYNTNWSNVVTESTPER